MGTRVARSESTLGSRFLLLLQEWIHLGLEPGIPTNPPMHVCHNKSIIIIGYCLSFDTSLLAYSDTTTITTGNSRGLRQDPCCRNTPTLISNFPATYVATHRWKSVSPYTDLTSGIPFLHSSLPLELQYNLYLRYCYTIKCLSQIHRGHQVYLAVFLQ